MAPIARPPLPQPIAPAAARSRPSPPLTPNESAAVEPVAPPTVVVSPVEIARAPLKPVEMGPKIPPIPPLRDGHPKEPPATSKPEDPFADLDALEAEMSRLLGRETQS
jgi:hypothetical protein